MNPSCCILLWSLFNAMTASAELVWEEDTLTKKLGATESSTAVMYYFTNKGAGPIVIGSVTTSCQCLVATVKKQKYEAGERGLVEVTFRRESREEAQLEAIHGVAPKQNSAKKTILVSVEGEEKPHQLTLFLQINR